MTDEPTELDIPDPTLDEEWETDTLSEFEEQYWPTYADVTKQKTANKVAIHKTVGCLIPAAIVIAFIMFLIVLGVYVAHLLLPVNRRWLTPDEVQHIHSMIFSSVVGGAITLAARTYFLDRDEP